MTLYGGSPAPKPESAKTRTNALWRVVGYQPTERENKLGAGRVRQKCTPLASALRVIISGIFCLLAGRLHG